ncbi:uncharacterized protein CEXT_247871 [Caerostris extrusa]|uniref:Uncharacterized protein n=1 Tax=Caerostris extrusa TaxID=172846 RepID=A0AAV4M6Q0_CAEEX|nr:uncharacterized protein CEXT_247871 [Caerostris extrusa]
MYGRAKTVRIGKWRWPPPRDDGAPPVSFLEFKQAAKQKKDSRDDGMEFQEFSGMEAAVGSSVVDSSTSVAMQGSHEQVKKSQSLDDLKEEDTDIVRAFEGNDKPSPGSIGKLRISSEMKAKLEQLTMDHSVRSTNKKETRAKVFPIEEPEEDSKKGSRN